MILLIGLNPIGLPSGGCLLGSDIAYFGHRREFHSVPNMFGLSSIQIFGDANVDNFITLAADILVGVSICHIQVVVVIRYSRFRLSRDSNFEEESFLPYYSYLGRGSG